MSPYDLPLTALSGTPPVHEDLPPADGPAALHPLAPADAGHGKAWAPRARQVRLGSTVVRVATSGEGPPLLLVNGIGGNIEMWEPVVRRIRDRQLIMFDAPGTGGSPALRRPRRLRSYATLVVRLLDELGLERTDVLGYSWGGALAQELAHRAPERVGALVLAATMPGLGGQPPAPWVVALMATPARYYSRTYLRIVAPVVFGSAPEQAADSAHGDARLRKPPTMRGYAQQIYAISSWSSRPFLRSLRAPTLVLAGAHDPLVPARNARILAREIPGARLQIVNGGHLFLLEQPDEGCRAVTEFLQQRGGRWERGQPRARSAT